MAVWTSNPGDGGAPFGSWRAHLADAFVRLEPRAVDAGARFAGTIRQGAGQSRAVSLVEADAHTVHRLPEHARLARRDLCFLNLQVRSAATVEQGGLELSVRPMDLTCVRVTEPFRIAHARPFALYSFAVETGDVPPPLLRSGLVRLGATQLGRRVARMMQDYAQLATNAPKDADDLVGQAVLLAGWATTRGGLAAAPAALGAAMIRGYVADMATDPDLSLGQCAAALGMAPRTLQDHLASEGETYSDLVRKARIGAACRLLGDPACRTGILDIALSVGFGDASHFSRCFRAATGMSPREYRAARSDENSRASDQDGA